MSGQPQPARNRRILALQAAHRGAWSAQQIAREIGDGCTRNAVIGVLNRAGFTRPKQLWPLSCRTPIGCRYILGHPNSPAWRYCQARQQQGSAYCALHHQACHRRAVGA